MSNTTKVWLFFLVSSLAILCLGYYLGDRLGLFVSFLVTLAFHGTLYLWGSSQFLKNYKYRKLQGPDAHHFYQTVQNYYRNIKKSNKRTAPDIFLIDSPECIALSLPFTYKSPAIGVSEWILEKLTEEERLALYKLLISRLEVDINIWSLALNQMANILVAMGDTIDRFNPIRFIFAKKIPIFAPLAQWLAFLGLKLIYRKNIFLQLDQRALSQQISAQTLAKVLDKLESFSQSRPAKFHFTSRHLFLVDPVFTDRNKFSSFHLPVEQRIVGLIGFYPL